MLLLLTTLLACDPSPTGGDGGRDDTALPEDTGGDNDTGDGGGTLGELACAEGADAAIVGGELEGAGYQVAYVGDLDGDGGEELAVVTLWTGLVCLFPGRTVGPLMISEATTCFQAAAEWEYLGAGMAAPGDVDGDGLADLALGAMGNSGPEGDLHNSGALYLVSASLDSDLAAPVILYGEAAGDYAGAAVVGAGDTDGDGTADILVGAYGNDEFGSGEGKVYLVRGDQTRTGGLLADAPVQFLGGREAVAPPHDPSAAGDALGLAIDGDMDFDGDGIVDLVLGANGSDLAGTDAGAAAIFLGPIPDGSWRLSDGDRLFLGEALGTFFGDQVVFAGDLDGDGTPDLASSGAMDERGRTWIFQGGLGTDPMTGAEALATWTGEADGDQAGYSLAAGDVDGDGVADLAVGAPYNDRGGDYSGAVYLIRGPVEGGAFELAAADRAWTGNRGFDYAGWALDLGDSDGDGTDDLVYGAYYAEILVNSAGTACLFRAP